VNNDLVMVMELADGQLLDRFRECRAQGQRGIPRDELLGYLRETAEALDMMGSKYGLQHLDVKPENIFTVSGHAKVGDYGLVRRMDLVNSANSHAGFTPKYTPPEVLRGTVDIRSDQYSLGLVYAELLVGQFPYSGRSAQQLMMQHVSGIADLSGLSARDRLVIGRVLSKDPADRFPSCIAFVGELTAMAERQPTPSVGSSGPVLNTPVLRVVGHKLPLPQPNNTDQTRVQQSETPTCQATTNTVLLRKTALVAATPADPFDDLTPIMRLDDLYRPRPRSTVQPDFTPRDFVEAVVRQVQAGPTNAIVLLTSAGARTVRFLSTIPITMMPYKLAVVAERWGLSARLVNDDKVVLRREVRQTGWRSSGEVVGGYEVAIVLPAPPSVEVTATATLFGKPDNEFTRTAIEDIPTILSQVRNQLQNLQERRIHPRYAAELPVQIYELAENGEFGPVVTGQTRDFSIGGVQFVTPSEISTERVFISFPSVPAIQGWAIYSRLLRSMSNSTQAGYLAVGRFRTQDAT
jgi:eukaryotic-like serine/threonine-protein kinase